MATEPIIVGWRNPEPDRRVIVWHATDIHPMRVRTTFSACGLVFSTDGNGLPKATWSIHGYPSLRAIISIKGNRWCMVCFSNWREIDLPWVKHSTGGYVHG